MDSSCSDGDSGGVDLANTSAFDSLFYDCDHAGTGRVKVSVLQAHILHKIEEQGAEEKVEDAYQTANVERDLSTLMNPNRQDSSLDISAFRSRICHVLQYINNRRDGESGSGNANVTRGSDAPKMHPCESSVKSPRVALFTGRSLLYESGDFRIPENYTSTPELEPAESCTTTRHEGLSFQIKRLTEENLQLKESLVSQEEHTAKMTQKVEAMQRELRSHQMMLEQRKSLAEENEELKSQVAALTDLKTRLVRENDALQRNNTSLENNNNAYQSQFYEVAAKLEQIEKEKESVETSLLETKKLNVEIEEVTAEKCTQLELKSLRLREVENILQEEKKLSEMLRSEKIDLELQLNKTQHELKSFLNKTDTFDVNSSVHLTPEELVLEEEEEPIQLPKIDLIAQPASPIASSTPFKPDSLCAEISRYIRDQPLLPSPLCTKESEYVRELGPAMRLSDELEKCLKSCDLLNRLKQPSQDPQQKQEWDKRLNKLRDGLVILKGHLSVTQNEMKKMVMDSKDLSRKFEAEKQIRIDQNNESETRIENLENQICSLNKSKEELEDKVINLELENTELVLAMTKSEATITSLERASEEMRGLYQQAEVDKKCIKTHLDTINKDYSELQQNSLQLKEELKRTKHQQDKDMCELWTLLNGEKNDQEGNKFGEEAAHGSIKDEVTKEIESLRSQLEKSQLALDALQKKAQSQLNGTSDRSANDQTAVTSSHLVEALTLNCWDRKPRTKQASNSKHNIHKSGTLSDENVLDENEDDFIRTQPPRFTRYSDLAPTDSSSCAEVSEPDDSAYFLQQRRPKTRHAHLKLKHSSRLKFSRIPYARGNRCDSNTTPTGLNTRVGAVPSRCRSETSKKNVFFVEGANPSGKVSDPESPDDFVINMADYVRYRTDSYEQAVGSRALRQSETSPGAFRPSPRARAVSFRKAVERDTSGDSGISLQNGNHGNGIYSEQADCSESGLYSINTSLRPSTFRSGYYDRDNMHVPPFPNHSHDIDALGRGKFSNWSKERNFRDHLTSQGKGGNNYIESIHAPASSCFGNYTSYDRSLSPNTRRRLSVLSEESASVEVDASPHTRPVPPPRRRGRSPKPCRQNGTARGADSSPKQKKDISNKQNKELYNDKDLGKNYLQNRNSGQVSNFAATGEEHNTLSVLACHRPVFHDVRPSETAGLCRRPVAERIQKHEPVFSDIMPEITSKMAELKIESPDFVTQSPVTSRSPRSRSHSSHTSDVTSHLRAVTSHSPRHRSQSPIFMKQEPILGTTLQPPGYKAPPSYKDTMKSRSRESSPRGESNRESTEAVKSRTGNIVPSSPKSPLTITCTKKSAGSTAYPSSKQSDDPCQAAAECGSVSLQSESKLNTDKLDMDTESQGTENAPKSNEVGDSAKAAEITTAPLSLVDNGDTSQISDGETNSQAVQEVKAPKSDIESKETVLLTSEKGSVSECDARTASESLPDAALSSSSDTALTSTSDAVLSSPASAGNQDQPGKSEPSPHGAELRRSRSFDESRDKDLSDTKNGEKSKVETVQKDCTFPPICEDKSPKKEIKKTESPTPTEDLADIKQEILKGLEKAQDSPSKLSVKPSSDLAKIREEKLAKKKLQKLTGMPELSENMENDATETKSSNDAVTTEIKATVPNGHHASNEQRSPDNETISDKIEASEICETQVYPSLSKNNMKKWGLHRALSQESPECGPELTEHEIEEKFTNVSLAFKTDKLTLDQRLAMHKRARDTIEQNIEIELKGLKEAMQNLSPTCNDMKSRELYCLISKHIEIIEHSHCRLASRAEIHGAVQQEMRVSRAIDVVVRHVDNLKRMYEREHQELEDTKRMLQENRLAGDQSGLSKGMQGSGATGTKGGRRRASLAVLPRGLPAALSLSPPSKDLDSKGRLQHLLDSTTSSVSSAFRRASLVARRASIAVSHTPSTPPALAPSLGDRTSHFSLSSPSLFQSQRYSRMSSQCSTVSTASSEDLSSPRQSLTSTIPENDDILEEVPMRYPAENPGYSTSYKNETESTADTNNEHATGTSSRKCNESESKQSDQEVQGNETESNNNNLSKDDLEKKAMRRRAIANQTIITDDDPDETQEEECPSRRSVPRASDDDMVQQALLFQERLRDLIERQDTVDDDDSGEAFLERVWQHMPDWKTFKLRARYTVGGLLFLLGMLCLVMTFIPATSAVTDTEKRRWSRVEDILWPFLSAQYLNPPSY